MAFLEHMRTRPEEERIAFAALMSGGIALVLFLLWGLFFFQTRTAPIQTASAHDAATDLKKSLSEVSTQYAQLRAAFEQVPFTAQESVEPVAEISVDKSGEVTVENGIVGPTR